MPKYSRRNRKSRKANKRSHSRRHRGGAVHSALQQGGKRRRVGSGKRVKKGGMLEGVVVAAKTALLPYLMYSAQKNMQSNVKTAKKTRRSRRR